MVHGTTGEPELMMQKYLEAQRQIMLQRMQEHQMSIMIMHPEKPDTEALHAAGLDMVASSHL